MEENSMTDNTYHFRSALGGFHKGDVAGYIEKSAVEHRSELLAKDQIISALREENHSLQQQLNLLMMATPVAPAAPAPAPAPAPEPAPAPMSAYELMTEELQAYRRAEAVERNATKRAKKLYHQMEDVCEDALNEFQSTDVAVKETLDAILAQANSLEQAYQSLSAALQASRKKLAALHDTLSDSEED